MNKPNPLTKEYAIWLNRECINADKEGRDYPTKDWTREEKDEFKKFCNDINFFGSEEFITTNLEWSRSKEKNT